MPVCARAPRKINKTRHSRVLARVLRDGRQRRRTPDPAFSPSCVAKSYDGVEDSHEDESDATWLRRLIDVQETGDCRTVDGPLQDKMHVLTCAAMALDVNDMETL